MLILNFPLHFKDSLIKNTRQDGVTAISVAYLVLPRFGHIMVFLTPAFIPFIPPFYSFSENREGVSGLFCDLQDYLQVDVEIGTKDEKRNDQES